jgi:ribose 5-phosphate isomerase
MQTVTKASLKFAAAPEALQLMMPGSALGIGSGSTVDIFIALPLDRGNEIAGAVAPLRMVRRRCATGRHRGA